MGIISLFFCLYIDVSLFNNTIIFALLVSSCINAITTIWLLKSVKYGDISLVGPLWAITIPLLYITSYYINGESMNLYWSLGVWLICIGTYFLWVWSQTWLLSPIKAIYHDRGARYMLLTAFLWSFSAPFDKVWIASLGVFSWVLLTSICIAIIMTPIVLYYRPKSFWELQDIKNIKKISLYSFLWWVILWLQFLALKYTLVIYVISIKRASGIFSVLLGYVFFKEKNIVWKFFATSLMVLGVAIITLFWNI